MFAVAGYHAVVCDVFILNIYVLDIHHILTFQTLGDTWPAAFYFG